MPTQSVKSRLFEEFARIGHALASGVRLEILELLAQGERSVDSLAKTLGQSVANVSQHLRQLRQAGLVVGRKQGQFILYRLAADDVVRLVSALHEVAEAHLAEVEKLVNAFFVQRDSLEPVAVEEVLDRAQRGLITVVDVRPGEEYAAGHLPGAVSIPLPELELRLGELPKRKEIVAYCRGPYCLMSVEAVIALRRSGYRARRLATGLPQWRSAGLPIATAES